MAAELEHAPLPALHDLAQFADVIAGRGHLVRAIHAA
jgi:hypothetical protein